MFWLTEGAEGLLTVALVPAALCVYDPEAARERPMSAVVPRAMLGPGFSRSTLLLDTVSVVVPDCLMIALAPILLPVFLPASCQLA